MRLCGSIKSDDSDTPQHLPLKHYDSTWDCGDLGLITHLWWKGGSTSVQSRLSYSHQWPNILTLYGLARVCLRAFFTNLSLQLRSSHLTSSTLISLVFFTLLFIQTLAGESLICALAAMKPLAEPHTVSTKTRKVTMNLKMNRIESFIVLWTHFHANCINVQFDQTVPLLWDFYFALLLTPWMWTSHRDISVVAITAILIMGLLLILHISS